MRLMGFEMGACSLFSPVLLCSSVPAYFALLAVVLAHNSRLD